MNDGISGFSNGVNDGSVSGVCRVCQAGGAGASGVCARCAVGSLLAMETELCSGGAIGRLGPRAEGMEIFDDVVPGVDLLRIQGSGGMGTVLKARQLSLDRDVAVKIIRADKAEDPIYEAALQEEARSMARLDHPGIVRVLDFGRTLGGNLYLLLEWVEGTTLRRLLDRRGALRAEEAAGLILPLCAALEHAHEGCVVHRDLKPENVLLTVDGQPKLADFGLARLGGRAGGSAPGRGRGSTPSGKTTAVGGAVGTPAYMAPEQADGVGLVDRRADLYALALMLQEMLTGVRPGVRPSGTGGEVGGWQGQLLPEETPLALRQLLQRNLSGAVQERTVSAKVFAEELRRIFGWEEAEGRPFAVSLKGRMSRRLWLTGLGAAALGAGVPLWWSHRRMGAPVVFDGKLDPLLDEAVVSRLPEIEKVLVARGSRPVDATPGLTRGTIQPLRPAVPVAVLEEMGLAWEEASGRDALELRLSRFAEGFLQSFDTDSPRSPEGWMSGAVETDSDASYYLNFGNVPAGGFVKKWAVHVKEFPHRYTMVMGRPVVQFLGAGLYEVVGAVWSRVSSGNRYGKIEASVSLKLLVEPGRPFQVKSARKSGVTFVPQNALEVRLSLHRMARLVLQLLAPESRQIMPMLYETRHFYQGQARTRVELEQMVTDGSPMLAMDRVRILNGPEMVRHTDWLHTGVLLGEVVRPVPEAGLKEGEMTLVLMTMEFEKIWPNIRSLEFRRVSGVKG